MSPDKVATRVAQLASSLADAPSDALASLTGELRTNAEWAKSTFENQFYILIALWLASTAIGVGIVSEATLGPFKLNVVKGLLVAAPMLVGYAYYRTVTSFALMRMLERALHSIYKVRYPKAGELGLEYLLDPPGMLSVHTFIEEDETRDLSWKYEIPAAWFYLWLLGPLLGGIAMFGHVSYLAVRHSGLPWWAYSPSIAIGLFGVVASLLFLSQVGEVM